MYLTPQSFLESYPYGPPEGEPPADIYRAAARQLGLKLVHVRQRIFLVKDGADVIGQLKGTGTSLNSKRAQEICRAKTRTTQYMARAGVPTPAQRSFATDMFDEALAFAQSRDFEVVVKPLAAKGGEGVTVDIHDAEDFRRAWATVVDLPAYQSRNQVLVEALHYGIDVRAIVIGGRMVCAASRIPASLVGDDVSTVAELVARRNASREDDTYYRRFPLSISAEFQELLRRRGLAPEAVLPRGERLFVTSVSNIHLGADVYDVTDLLAPSIVAVAENAARAIPGLGAAGVDLIIPSLDGELSAVVIEVNGSANLNPHYRPTAGRRHAPALEILKEMQARHRRRTPFARWFATLRKRLAGVRR